MSSKGSFSKFITGKGFYAALAICVIGAGTAAWVAVDRTITSIDQSNANQLSNSAVEAPIPTPAPVEDVAKPKEKVPVSQAPASSSQASEKTEEKQTPPVTETAKAQAEPIQTKITYAMPISGEVFGVFSKGELVKNPTLKEWRTHDGIDIKAAKGTPVKAAADGVVTLSVNDPLMGYMVEVKHNDGTTSIYCGLTKDMKVKKDDKVKLGQEIGVVGEVPSELASEPHLHFAMKKDGKWVNPLVTMGKMAE